MDISINESLKAFAKPAGLALGVAALGLYAFAGSAAADDHMGERPGYYVGIGVGYNGVPDSDVDGGSIFQTEADYDDDLPSFGYVALGFDYDGPLRGELELGHRSNDVDTVNGIDVGGSVDVTSFMLNAFYDFEGVMPRLTPYIGGGLGIAHMKANDITLVNTALSDGSSNVFAGQLIAGAAYEVVENLDLTAQYNYFLTTDGEFTNALGQEYDLDYKAHSVTLGLRLNFPQPKPAPEPAPEPVAAEPEPAPAPAPEPEPEPEPEIVRNFLVFFDWDSAVVTPEAMDVLRQAVDYARTGGIARIQLTGHADRSGPATYNMGLSQRRADAVRTEITGLGFGGTVNTVARGEQDPLVQTEDGVREPQNRRVEIELQ